jgi:hypothetical protein
VQRTHGRTRHRRGGWGVAARHGDTQWGHDGGLLGEGGRGKVELARGGPRRLGRPGEATCAVTGFGPEANKNI